MDIGCRYPHRAEDCTEADMKKIEAIIKPYKLASLKSGLDALGITGMTVSEVLGFGNTGGKSDSRRDGAPSSGMVPRMQVTIAVAAELADTVVRRIIEDVRSGSPGDGKIFIQSVEKVYRIRTGEVDGDAL